MATLARSIPQRDHSKYVLLNVDPTYASTAWALKCGPLHFESVARHSRVLIVDSRTSNTTTEMYHAHSLIPIQILNISNLKSACACAAQMADGRAACRGNYADTCAYRKFT